MPKENNVIKRDGYTLYFMDPKDEKGLNDLTNTGKVVGIIMITDKTDGDSHDESVVAVRD